ncbi:MAG: helix-turn-helix domain-containing protein [Salinibacterium amurskyense]
MLNELDQVGPRLRAARHERGLTLEDAARQAQMSPSTLSRLESGKRQASLELLVPLTRQLGIRIDDLIAPAVRDPRVRRPTVQRDGITIVPLAPDGSAIQTYKITYQPTVAECELRVHDGYEWLYVLSGKLRLRLGEQDLVLNRGEAAEFDTRVPHAISAAGKSPAQILSIFNHEGERMHTHAPAD